MEFASSATAAEDKTTGRELLQSHVWCPNYLARLWDGLDHLKIQKT